jgi:hypothetical protein
MSLPTPVPCLGCWQPALETRWQYQLQGVKKYRSTGGIDVLITAVPFTGGPPVAPDAFDIDLYVDPAISGDNDTVDAAAVEAIHAQGDRAVCYVDAGTWRSGGPTPMPFPIRSKEGRTAGPASAGWTSAGPASSYR